MFFFVQCWLCLSHNNQTLFISVLKILQLYINNRQKCSDWLSSDSGLVFSDNMVSKSTQRSLFDFMKNHLETVPSVLPIVQSDSQNKSYDLQFTCRYKQTEMEYTSQLFKNRFTVNIGMFSFIVSCLHFKSNISKGNLTEIMPGKNYYLTTSMSKCFTQMFLISMQNFAGSAFFSCTNSNLP